MPKKTQVTEKNKYSETIKSKLKKPILGEDLEEDDEEYIEPKSNEKPTDQVEDKSNDKPTDQVEEKPAEKPKTKRKYVKKPVDLYAGPVETAQYNSVLERVNSMAELFLKLQEDQVKLNSIVRESVKAHNADQYKKIDNALQESRDFFARLAK